MSAATNGNENIGGAAANTSTIRTNSSSGAATKQTNNPLCKCGVFSVTRKTKIENANKGREFYTCAKPSSSSCKYFKWIDKETKSETTSRDVVDETFFDVIIYTDGGCKGNRNVSVTFNPAGW